MITLATLAQATEQEVFDQVAIHLLTQGLKSVNKDLSCSYRGINGLKCAAGCLISDEEYLDLEFYNGISWDGLVHERKVTLTHESLILRLQQIHDRVEVSSWLARLTACAESIGLNSDVVKNFKKDVDSSVESV